MSFRAILYFVFVLLLVAPAVEARSPNVVMIVADDEAWTDFGFMGHPVIKTPHLDRLAGQSAVFKRAYVPMSLCRPSLATLLTGKYPHQHKISGNDPTPGVDRREMLRHIRQLPTVPKLLGAKGYLSFQAGKWWEGEYSLGGFTGGMTHGDPRRGGRHGDDGLKIGREGMKPVLDFIDGCGEKPFFLWYAPMLPHAPHTPPERLLQKYLAADRPIEVSRYYAMCEWFDETCGTLLDHLDKKKLANDTLVVFVTDNGWIQRTPKTAVPPGWRYPFAPRSKLSPYEGGIRSPILLRWPGHLKPATYETLVSSIDLAPTVLAAAGIDRDPGMPGLNLLEIAGNAGKTDRAAIFGEIFSHNVPDIDDPAAGLQYRWCIEGNWKLIIPRDPAASVELFDVIADPHETNNLASEKPEVVARLRVLTDAWWPAASKKVAGIESAPSVTTGLPSDMAVYRADRERLRVADDEKDFDSAMTLNGNEEKLSLRLGEVRDSLVKKYRAAKRFPASEPFNRMKSEIQASNLFSLLRQMPKGGVLHLHTSSTAPATWIVTEGIREPGCHVCWPNDSGQAIKGQLSFFAPGKAPAGYLPVQQVLETDPEFRISLLRLITINETDTGLTNLQIWQKFDQIFQRIGGLHAYQPVFMKYYDFAFRTLLADNVFYVELRAGFGDLYDLEGKTWSYLDRASLWWDIRNQIRKDYPQFDLKLIYSGYRSSSVNDVWSQIEQAVALRKIWADRNFVVGFDLVGEEDSGHKTKYFLDDWVKLKTYLAQQQTTLPFYFHDGESDWPSDRNLYDAFLLGTRRVGHGFNLFRFPTLQEEFRKNRIAVEVCPVSNQQLRYVNDLRMHPAVGFLNEGIPCVLSSDDPGIFGNDGLTYDFWEATVAWKLDLRALKQLAFNSLQFSAMTDAEKSAALAHWNKTWDDWVAKATN